MATYKKLEPLAEGGFGRVFLGVRTDDNWPCVIKYLRVPHDAEDLVRFKREARMQSQLDHPNVLPIVGMNLTVDPPWFAMPRAAMNLREFIQTRTNYDPVAVFVALATGVDYAHGSGVIHRDLKPENVLVFFGEDGNARFAVSDFGLGRKTTRDTTTITQKNVRMGTVEYMAPEQWSHARDADIRADVFALGKILYELLTRDLPHPALNLSLVPDKFRYVCQKATQLKPESRYQSVAELIAAIRLITDHPDAFERSADRLEHAIQEFSEARDDESEILEEIARILSESTNDAAMLAKQLPRIPDPLLKGLIEQYSDLFRAVFQAYDAQIDDGVTFTYCDTIANFYERVFKLLSDDDCRITILRRLAKLGPYNNRWHVGTVFARLVSKLDSPSLIIAVAESLRADPHVREWNAAYLKSASTPRLIRDALSTP